MKQILLTAFTILLLQILVFLLLPVILVKDRYYGKADAVVVDSSGPELKEAEKLYNDHKTGRIYLITRSGNESVVNEGIAEKVSIKRVSLEHDSREILKVLLKNNHKSVIVFSKKYDSRRYYLTYTKFHQPVGIEVYADWVPEKWNYLNWMNDESAIQVVTGNFFKLVLYFFKGYI